MSFSVSHCLDSVSVFLFRPKQQHNMDIHTYSRCVASVSQQCDGGCDCAARGSDVVSCGLAFDSIRTGLQPSVCWSVTYKRLGMVRTLFDSKAFDDEADEI